MALPGFLYKYRSLADSRSQHFARDILRNRRLYFPHPSSFNDPFEFRYTITMEGKELVDRIFSSLKNRFPKLTAELTRAQLEEALKLIRKDSVGQSEIYEKTRNEFSKITYMCQHLFGHLRESTGVLSLSALCDDILMWSHYADSHRGICLGFSIRKDCPFWNQAMPVVYRPDFPVIRSQEQVNRAMLTKADHWKYEQEWRIVSRNTNGLEECPSNSLAVIILGSEISDSHKKLVKGWIRDYCDNVTMKQARISPGSYKLELDETGV